MNRPSPARALTLSTTAAGCALLAACGQAVAVPAAPHAADPVCAAVVLAMPETLDGMPRLETTSQATTAWGDRTAPVVARCGVEPPGPTTDPCVDADDGAYQVDWVAIAGAEDADGAAPWTFVTYGRDPAVEVRVPASVASSRSTSFLLDLGPAVSLVEQTRSCL
ncbi:MULTISPECIES: DUF3515 family protein [unclassified Actinotalea]|uniref:DUF3515 family protein n=1 Tax=unclassified Actinotalea TaxID=2638618 RepID=UPI0015F55310|nr:MULTISPECIES: DUF3515 family protein [unclassified Actinotalea]